MKVTFLGTGVAVPFENRAQSSILIEENGVKILIDAGIGCYHRLEQLGFKLEDIDAICFTHHHLDHNGDLLNILKARWLLGRNYDIQIFGPPGTECFLESLFEAYPYLRGKLRFSVSESNKFSIEGIKFEAIPTYHSIESRGYLIDDALAVSGDTKAFERFISLECEIMIHEMSLPFGHIADYHTTPENLKNNLKFCKATRIYLTHLYPMAHAVRDEIVRYLEYETVIAEDMMSFTI